MPSRLPIVAFLYIYLDRERSSGLSQLSSVARAMDLASGEAASREFIFVICIILLSLRARDLRKKYDCSQSIFHCFRSFSLLFYLSVKEIYISFLDFLERNSSCLLAFPLSFPGVELLSLHDLLIDSLLVLRLPTEKPPKILKLKG